MSEELKKTTLMPRFGNRMPYNTVVMDKPPEMTVEFARAEGKVTHNLRVRPPVPPPVQHSKVDPGRTMPPPVPADSKGPKATHLAPIEAGPGSVEQGAGKQTSIASLRTRMMNVKAMPTFHNPVGADAQRPPPPPPPPPSTLHVTPLAHRGGRKQNLRKVLFVGGAAMVLGVCLILSMTGTSKQAEAETQQSAKAAKAPAEPLPAAEPLPGAEPLPAARLAAAPIADASPDSKNTPATATAVTEQQAGTMLLEGRRKEALAMYRELANSSKSTPGIQAMLEVLTQKVATP